MEDVRSPKFLSVNSMFTQCDEMHPICIQCNTAQLRCRYALGKPSGPAQPGTPTRTTSRDGSSTATPVENHSSSTISPRLVDPSISHPHLLISANSDDPFTVNMLHIKLLHHFSTETAKTFIFDERDAKKSQDLTMKAALSAPYLMQEILALAALHMSVLFPDQREFYHHQASGLQTRALSIFNSSHL
jgi:hypothetical protein